MKARFKSSLAFAATSMILAGAASGATLASGGSDLLVAGDVNDDYVVSVNANNSGYANTYSALSNVAYQGTTINKSFNYAIAGYRFVNRTNPGGINQITNVVESGGIVSLMTTTDTTYDSFGQNALDLYTSTDPGANLLSPVGANNFTAGIRDLTDFSGSVDISGITEGSIYLFYGKFNAGGGVPSLTATMSGTALTDILSGSLTTGAPAPVSGQNIYVTRIDFVNDLGYESIAYTSNGTRLVGAVVTSIPEPSSLALLGFSGLAFLRRRR